jgi:hypothetical protein
MRIRKKKFQGYYTVRINPDDQYDILVETVPYEKVEKIPTALLSLIDAIENTQNTLKSIECEDTIKKQYFDKLLSLSQAGLVGENPQPILANVGLDSLKLEVLNREGGKVKNKYMVKLVGYAILLAIIPYLIILSVQLFLHNIEVFNTLSNVYLAVWSSSMIGVWFSFGVRKTNLRFEDLVVIEKDRLNPIVRLIFIGTAALVLALLIRTEIVSFSIGKINSQSINNNIEMAIALGFFSGLMEHKLAINLYTNAVNKLNSAININFKDE